MGDRLSILSESRVREIRSLGSMRRDVETESWHLDCGTAIRKGRQQLRGAYHHRATSRPYDHLRSVAYPCNLLTEANALANPYSGLQRRATWLGPRRITLALSDDRKDILQG